MDSSPSNHPPGVSIAMATYNGYAFLAEQLDSLLGQSIQDFEIIIVDDCSTDDTRGLLKSYQQKDNRIRLFFNERNLGYREAFYKAVDHCKSDLVLFCDQDDRWLPDKINTLITAMGDNLLVFSDSALVNEKGMQLQVKLSDTVQMLQPGANSVNRGFVIGNCVWGHTILFHRSLLNHTRAGKKDHPHDWWFAVVSSHLNKIKFCPEVLNDYRQHTSNVTQAIPVKAGKVAGRKLAEFELQLSRLQSIATLDCNHDRAFYEEWLQLFLRRKKGFSFSLLKFLVIHRKDVFSLKRKTWLAQMVEIRKMCRKVE